MLSIIPLKVGQLQTNCYLVFSQNTKRALIIDPGDDSDLIKNTLSKNELVPKLILATHGHFDHILAAFDLQTSYNLPFFINKNDVFLLDNLIKNTKYYLKITPDPPPKITGFLKDKEFINFEESKFQIIHTPGHTPGSVCLYFPTEKWLFTGDTYFSEGIFGRTDFSYSSKNDLTFSLEKIKTLISASKIVSGH